MADESSGREAPRPVPGSDEADNAEPGEDTVFPEPFRALMRRVFGPLNRLNRLNRRRRR